MTNVLTVFLAVSMLLYIPAATAAETITLDESPVVEGEWGYRPAEGSVSHVNPPGFTWRSQEGLTWEIECARNSGFGDIAYRAEGIEFNVHCPPEIFKPGKYFWRYRGRDSDGAYTHWSAVRSFTIAPDASAMPLPRLEELLARIPKTHPRLFVRPENLGNLRSMAGDDLRDIYDILVDQCEALIADPPDTEEPPKYHDDIVRGSDPWRSIWWGNRMRVVRALNGAATLAFTRLVGGPEKYGIEAKRILLECARWDPKGSTGYRYNDEAGMPYAYFFSRTYTFVNDLLSEEEKETCRRVMKIRGDEMYEHLCPRHLWKPYSSHSNRAWHFLGEVGIAFMNEIEGADDWVWFAANVFFNAYPVWSDDDGGWHEGVSYWWEYQERFTWFADVMREALGIDAFDKPYYSQVGYYAIYLMPPGSRGTGFGDLVGARDPSSYVPLMKTFTSQAGNGHWQWWVERMGGTNARSEYHGHGNYISFIHGAMPGVEAVPPDDLPTSRLFLGTGQAFLNSDLTDGGNNVQIAFKSSPFGTQSHGYEASNSFLLWAYGEHLLIRTGRRDSYGSDHHRNWMWSTRSVNCIRIGGQDQPKRSPKAKGEITAFKTTKSMDIVVGETENFRRAILFVKPDLIVVYDRLASADPTFYEYWLHAVNEIEADNQHDILVRSGDVVCNIDFLAPDGLTFVQTDQYDPNPRPRIKLRQWHLTATTTGSADRMEFVTVYRPHRIGEVVPKEAEIARRDDGYALKVRLGDGDFSAVLPASFDTPQAVSGGAIVMRLERDGRKPEILRLDE